MAKRKNTQLTNDEVLGIWKRVSSIQSWNHRRELNLLRSRCPDTTRQIAIDFNVDRKTVNRIASQECYRDVTENYEKNCRTERANHPMLGRQMVPATSEELINLDAEISYYKGKVCLRHDLPMHYGYCRGWDRFHNIVSDGFILLLDDIGLDIALRAKNAGISDGPYFSDTAQELPTFELFELLTQEVGTQLMPREAPEGREAYLVDSMNSILVCIDRVYYDFAKRLKCEIRLCPGNSFVYIAHVVPDKFDRVSGKISHDETIKIVAVVATMGA